MSRPELKSAEADRFASQPQVMRCGELEPTAIESLLARYRLISTEVANDKPIPGSFWGAPEAGLRGSRLYWRPDTPVHSLLHELAHCVCMDSDRRARLDTDAGGDDDEECAVCYLELVLAAQLPAFGLTRCLADMDAWGYSFREGSAAAWFTGDGAEAKAWLLQHDLILPDDTPTWRLRL